MSAECGTRFLGGSLLKRFQRGNADREGRVSRVAVAAAHRGRQGLSSLDRPCLQRDAKPRCGAIAPENSTDLSHMLPQLGGASSKRSVVTVTLIFSSTISQLGAGGRRYNLGI